MNHDIIPPPRANLDGVDINHLDLATPLYQLVNRNPRIALFPANLTDQQYELYRGRLSELFVRPVLRIDTVPCRKPEGPFRGMNPGWLERIDCTQKEWLERIAVLAERERFGFQRIVGELGMRLGRTGVPDPREDLWERAIYFFRTLQARSDIPVFGLDYAEKMCYLLCCSMQFSPPPILVDMFPLLLMAPPLGFNPEDSSAYLVLVP